MEGMGGVMINWASDTSGLLALFLTGELREICEAEEPYQENQLELFEEENEKYCTKKCGQHIC